MSDAKISLQLIIVALLFIIILFGTLILKQSGTLEQLRDALKYKVSIISNNIAYFFNPPRRAPLSTVVLEESLKHHLPIPFRRFNAQDWRWFWNLLYGRFPVGSGGWPKRREQLTRHEVQKILRNNYQTPFGKFNERQWAIFWRDVLKGKVFKR